MQIAATVLIPIPEAETYVMFMASLGLASFITRRCKVV
jgi:hypothetical protein